MSKKHYAFLITAVISIGVLRSLLYSSDLAYLPFFSSLYTAVYFYWAFSIKKRFLNRSMVKVLLVSAAMLILWNFIKLLRYDFTPSGSLLSRYLWYVYYVFIIMLPVLMLRAVMYVGKTDSYSPPDRVKLIYIPAAVLIAAILTNDLHGLAFDLGPRRSDVDYVRGPFYYAAVAFTGLTLLAVIAVVLSRYAKQKSKKRFAATAAVVIICVLYTVFYGSTDSEKSFIQKMYEFPDFMSLFFVAFWESLVFARAIPSNAEHESFFRASSIKAGLTDNEYNVVLSSPSAPVPTRQQLARAEFTREYLDDKTTLLKTVPVRGGSFFWTEDMSRLLLINEDLTDTSGYLAEEYAMLNQTDILEESRKITSERNRLYDVIAEKLKPQLDALDKILNTVSQDEESFCTAMKKAGVTGAYVKRYSNLLILSSEGQLSDSAELFLCINESFIYLKLANIACSADIPTGMKLSSESIMFMYELFEKITEFALDNGLKAELVTLTEAKNGVRFYIETAADGICKDPEIEEKARELGFKMTSEYYDGVFFTVLETEAVL